MNSNFETLSKYKATELDDNCDAETFKRVLLPIVIAKVFSKKYAKQYSFDRLREGLEEYNSEYQKEVGRHPRGSGGGNSVRDLGKSETSVAEIGYVFAYNDDFVAENDLKRAVELLGFVGNSKDYRGFINGLKFCQALVLFKLPAIHDFVCNFVSISGNSYRNGIDFLNSGEALSDLQITLVGKPKLPSTVDDPNDGADQDHFYVAHYLNSGKIPLMATVTFKRKNSRVVSVYLEQFEDISGRRPGIAFKSIDETIVNGSENGPLFVVQESVPKDDKGDRFYRRNPQFQSLTISNEIIDGCRFGSYTSVVSHVRSDEHQYPVTGMVIMQRFQSLPDLEELDRLLDQFGKGRLPETDKSTWDLCHSIFLIRYRLHQGVFDYRKKSFDIDTRSWTALVAYSGKYVCYYMRLSRPPAEFQTSRIEIFPDGSATLEQSPDDNTVTKGYARVHNERLWLYFGINEAIGEFPIRFIVDDTNEERGAGKLRGTFQSETMVEHRLVSGLMSMTRVWTYGHEIPKESVWPEFFAKKYHEVVKSDFMDLSDFQFFLSGKAGGHLLNDGFAWADISERLGPYSAIDKISRLLGEHEAEQLGTEFYYFTFKKDVNQKQSFIERNLVRFSTNGTVSILAPEGLEYTGTVYFLKNTLRLSLVNQSGGFLEVFLKFSGERAAFQQTDILYGASLWHSDDRIQAKTVVLTRVNVKQFEETPKVYRFETAEEHIALKTADTDTQGLFSYLRGEHSRFLHSPKDPLPNFFRPRDKSSREFHFYIACFLGYQLGLNLERDSDEEIDEEVLQRMTGHLRNCFVHGYATAFAGITFSVQRSEPSYADAKKAYINRFFSGVSAIEKSNMLDMTQIKNTIIQIHEIAQEQRFLISCFQFGGPLNHKSLYDFASHFWPELLPKKENRARGK